MKPKENSFGITVTTSITIRSNPDHKSELLFQLLFGESFKIINKVEDWLLINTLSADIHGWIPDNSYIPARMPGLMAGDLGCYVNLQLISLMRLDDPGYTMTVLPGSTLPCRPEMGKTFSLEHATFRFDSPVPEAPIIQDNLNIDALALIFIHSPYLWGGRSLFGIDNIGLIHLIFKMRGINLPGNMAELVKLGSQISFVHDSQAGDLAFFENKEGEIIHVGIVTKPGKIVHCFGTVREDSLDHAGIYGTKEEKYLFYLRVVNRIL